MKNNKTILIVEDDTPHRTMLGVILSSWGYSTFEARNGPAALKLSQQKNVDLVLMDIHLAQESGIEVLAEIKTFKPCMPVVLMTAYCPAEIIVEAKKVGATDILIKPLDLDELEEVISMIFEQECCYSISLSSSGKAID